MNEGLGELRVPQALFYYIIKRGSVDKWGKRSVYIRKPF